MLKKTVCRLDSARLNKEPAGDTLLVERNDFARLNLADEFGVDGVECAGFARYYVCARRGFADAQRPDVRSCEVGKDTG